MNPVLVKLIAFVGVQADAPVGELGSPVRQIIAQLKKQYTVLYHYGYTGT